MSDVFVFNVHNPAEACMEITHVYISDHATNSNIVEVTEGETVNFDEDVIDIHVKVKNNGEEDGDAIVEIRDDSNSLLESGQQNVPAGQEVTFNFNNGGNGYTVNDGETRYFKVTVSP